MTEVIEAVDDETIKHFHEFPVLYDLLKVAKIRLCPDFVVNHLGCSSLAVVFKVGILAVILKASVDPPQLIDSLPTSPEKAEDLKHCVFRLCKLNFCLTLLSFHHLNFCKSQNFRLYMPVSTLRKLTINQE